MTDYSIPDPSMFRCDCGRSVRISNSYLVKVVMIAHIDNVYTPVKSVKRMCVKCKHDYEYRTKE